MLGNMLGCPYVSLTHSKGCPSFPGFRPLIRQRRQEVKDEQLNGGRVLEEAFNQLTFTHHKAANSQPDSAP